MHQNDLTNLTFMKVKVNFLLFLALIPFTFEILSMARRTTLLITAKTQIKQLFTAIGAYFQDISSAPNVGRFLLVCYTAMGFYCKSMGLVS